MPRGNCRSSEQACVSRWFLGTVSAEACRARSRTGKTDKITPLFARSVLGQIEADTRSTPPLRGRAEVHDGPDIAVTQYASSVTIHAPFDTLDIVARARGLSARALGRMLISPYREIGTSGEGGCPRREIRSLEDPLFFLIKTEY